MLVGWLDGKNVAMKTLKLKRIPNIWCMSDVYLHNFYLVNRIESKREEKNKQTRIVFGISLFYSP